MYDTELIRMNLILKHVEELTHLNRWPLTKILM